MKCNLRGLAIIILVGCTCGAGAESTRLRVMAANISSGNKQSYDLGEGARILQGLDPDVVLIQEFNYAGNTDAEIKGWVTTTFGPEYVYYREEKAQIPNGVISKYPILASGEWDDASVANRDFAWARIDVPGSKDLWVVSCHLLTKSAAVRTTEATQLAGYIKANVPEGDYLLVGGDLNTNTRTEPCIAALAPIVVTGGPYPADKAGNDNTNAKRAKPYDWLLADGDLEVLKTSTVVGASTFPNGLVFDSRVYAPLSEVVPVKPEDSAAPSMQHMAVVRDFIIPSGPATKSK